VLCICRWCCRRGDGYLLLITFGRRGLAGAFLADLGIVFSFR